MVSVSQAAKEKLVVALDVDTKQEAASLISELKDYVGVFKVGLQLLTKEGPEIVNIIKSEGCKIFYDGKFHDIPNTVAKAGANTVRLGVDIFDIHISGGAEMISTTVQEAKKTADSMNIEPPKILGISVLSSIDQDTLNNDIKVSLPVSEYVAHLAKLAKSSGLDGVVASVKEIEIIRNACGKDFIILCPGIRPSGADINDQKRIATPAEAIKLGANYLVVGRPITNAQDRVFAASKILEEIESAI